MMSRRKASRGVRLILMSTLFFPVAAFAEGAEADIRVVMTDFAFGPVEIVIPKEKTVRLTLVNEGNEEHEFVTKAFVGHTIKIEGSGIEIEGSGIGEIELDPGQRATIKLPPLPAGRFDLVCEEEGHLEKGMKAVLTIR